MSRTASPRQRTPARSIRRGLWLAGAAWIAAVGCGPHGAGAGPHAPRQGTAGDVVLAAAAEAPRAAVMLPVELARASSQHDQGSVPGAAGTHRPRTPHPTSLCDQVPAPEIDAAVARFERHPAGDPSASAWTLELAGPLFPPPPGPLAEPQAAVRTKPVRLLLRSTSAPERIVVTIHAGGWLLCALPTLQLLVDGTPIGELEGQGARRRSGMLLAQQRAAPAGGSLEAGANIDAGGARFSLELTAELLRTLLAARAIELRWDGGRIELYPQQHEAVRSLAAHLRQVHDATAVPAIAPRRGNPT